MQPVPAAGWKVSAVLGVLDRIQVPPRKGFPLLSFAIPEH